MHRANLCRRWSMHQASLWVHLLTTYNSYVNAQRERDTWEREALIRCSLRDDVTLVDKMWLLSLRDGIEKINNLTSIVNAPATSKQPVSSQPPYTTNQPASSQPPHATNNPVSSQPCQRSRDDHHKSPFSSRFAVIQALHNNYEREVKEWEASLSTTPHTSSYRPIRTL